MEAQLIQYLVSHPGQVTSGLVLTAFAIMAKWFLGRLDEDRKRNEIFWKKNELALQTITQRLEASEGAITDNRHRLVGADGDNGIMSTVREHTQRLNRHADQIKENQKEISILKTKVGT